MNAKLIYAAVGLLFLSYAVSLYNAAKRLVLRPLLPKNFALFNGAVVFELPLVALNDSNNTIPVSGFAFDLFVNGSFLSKVYAFDLSPIKSGETVVTARVVIPFLDLINLVPELKNAGRSVSFRFAGNVRLLELLTIPLPDFNLSLPIPKLS